ncbi:hypothetical protein AAC387_Pa07g2894 [Persea americana]
MPKILPFFNCWKGREGNRRIESLTSLKHNDEGGAHPGVNSRSEECGRSRGDHRTAERRREGRGRKQLGCEALFEVSDDAMGNGRFHGRLPPRLRRALSASSPPCPPPSSIRSSDCRSQVRFVLEYKPTYPSGRQPN